MPTKFHIQYIIILLFLAAGIDMTAQGNQPNSDDKQFHFGFLLGFNAFDFGIQESGLNQAGAVYHADVSTLQPGFSVGIITDMLIVRNLNVRFNPTLHFAERQLTYRAGKNPETTTISLSSIPLCLPLNLKFSSERKGNFRPYIITGLGVYYDLATYKDQPVLLKPIDAYAEIGLGCDLYFSFFKLAPELKLAFGLNDMFVPLDARSGLNSMPDEDKIYSLALSKLTSRMLTLSFNFE